MSVDKRFFGSGMHEETLLSTLASFLWLQLVGGRFQCDLVR